MAEPDIIFEESDGEREEFNESKEKGHFPEISVKKDLREHLLARPDTYLGNFVFDRYTVQTIKEGKMIRENIEYNPAFERCIIEAGSNCIDNVWRSQQFGIKCTAIRFTYYPDGKLSFWNDGLTVPIQKSTVPEMSHLYNPSLVFGVFMSSTNYDDSEKRRTSGRNGVGIKGCNTMSKIFVVETQDEARKLFFQQTWRDNMSIAEEPLVTPRIGKGYTNVTWLPDYHRFGMSGLSEGIIRLIKKYLYDVAMTAKVPVYINNELIPVKSLLDYALSTRTESTEEFLHIQHEGSEVVIFPQRPSQIVSYVNGIPTPQGGVHVDAWTKAIFTPLLQKINKEKKEEKETKKEDKKPRLTMVEIKAHFTIFIVASLDNPGFTSQEKVKLTKPKPETSFKTSQLNKMLKWSVISRLEDLLTQKALKAQTKKMEGGRKASLNVDKLEDANLAGTSRSQECVLIYCEGDSAKTYAVTGIEKGLPGKQGRDFFGILPCGGKTLNVRKALADKIASNKGVQSLIQALGLEIGADYSDPIVFQRLRYGQIMIISDADVDGIHIEGLCHNFFHKMFPSLLAREDPPFIISMRTPLIRVTLKSGEEKAFYREQAFKDFQNYHGEEIKGKPIYFKGLGGSDDYQVIESFGQRLVTYYTDQSLTEEMTKAFGKHGAKDRKKWMADYNPDDVLIIEDEKAKIISQSYSSFINNDLVTYSTANCDRSLPSMIDGLKESQRKVIYTMFKRGLFHSKPAMKVYRIASAVGDLTEYTHGDNSLSDTMVGMTWDFVGSNNIPLLSQKGQFGSRCAWGRDAANTRYSGTTLEEITEYIFRKEDMDLLTYIKGEDDYIEPEYYVPILPMVLVNGIRAGIGTGWSSKVPAYNPLDILKCLKVWITNNLDKGEKLDEKIFLSDLPEISPWYHGFEGEIIRQKVHQYSTYGVIVSHSDTVKEVTELPIGMSTDSFRDKLKLLRAEEKILDFNDYCSKTKVRFVITEHPDKMICDVKTLGLSKSVATSNMVGFDSEGKIKKYDCIDEIIYDFANVRIKLYQKRKDFLIKSLDEKIILNTSKRRFVEEIIKEDIEIYRKKRTEIISVLTERKYPLIEGKYDYLLKMSIESFTEDMIIKLDGVLERLKKELNIATITSPRDMWMKELLEFEQAYQKYLNKWVQHQALVNCSRTTSIKAPVKKRVIRKRKN